MIKNNDNLLYQAINTLLQSSDTLTKISDGCCMPGRSANMQEAHLLLNEVIVAIKETDGQRHKAQKGIKAIGDFASKLGFLYATCCTSIREPLYQSIFKDLLSVHSDLSKVLGHSH
ncbi:MAG: hypothetical protein HRU20_17240 [Pseudomonadales bacterium]|nr:hypothetical protein [Pseudomonadales bacterium]